MPLGICTIECSESTPCRCRLATGTPSTGTVVLAASMPGRCAAPPAPAMMRLQAARRPRLRHRRTCRRACGAPRHPGLVGDAELGENLRRVLQGLPVAGRAHHHADHGGCACHGRLRDRGSGIVGARRGEAPAMAFATTGPCPRRAAAGATPSAQPCHRLIVLPDDTAKPLIDALGRREAPRSTSACSCSPTRHARGGEGGRAARRQGARDAQPAAPRRLGRKRGNAPGAGRQRRRGARQQPGRSR